MKKIQMYTILCPLQKYRRNEKNYLFSNVNKRRGAGDNVVSLVNKATMVMWYLHITTS